MADRVRLSDIEALFTCKARSKAAGILARATG